MFTITVHNALMSQVQWRGCGSYDVAYISGILGKVITENDEEQWTLLPHQTQIESLPGISDTVAVMPSTGSLVQSVAPRSLLHVGHIALKDFKQKLSLAGIPAEFRGTGKLVAGAVTVQAKEKGKEKEKGGKITLSGKLGKDYFRVREQLYQQYLAL